MVYLATQTFSLKGFASGFATAPRVFTKLSKPILFLYRCSGFHVEMYWMISWS